MLYDWLGEGIDAQLRMTELRSGYQQVNDRYQACSVLLYIGLFYLQMDGFTGMYGVQMLLKISSVGLDYGVCQDRDCQSQLTLV